MPSHNANCFLEVRPGIDILKYGAPIGCYAASEDGLAFGDGNGDGKLDLISQYGAALGRGDGTFHAQPMFHNPGRDLYHQVVADMNGDGKPDLVGVGRQRPQAVSVMLGNNNGTLRPGGTTMLALYDALDVEVVDFNGDHKLDPVACGTGDVAVALGNGDGTFGAPIDNPGGGRRLVAGDWNRDGKMDIASVVNGVKDSLSVSLGRGDGTLAEPSTYNLVELHLRDSGRAGRGGLQHLLELGGHGAVGVGALREHAIVGVGEDLR